MIYQFLFWTIWALHIGFWIWYDKNRIIGLSGHIQRFIMRYGIAFLNAFLWSPGQPMPFREWIGVMLLQGAVFWIVFDAGKNIAEDKPVTYVGEISRLDRIFGDSFAAQIIAKIILLIVSILIIKWQFISTLL